MADSNQCRPKYTSLPCSAEDDLNKLCLTPSAHDHDIQWVPMLSSNADFPLELFEVAMLQLIHHPEYNSTLILRSEIINDTSDQFNFPTELPALAGHRAVRNIRRKLLPRRPGRDPPIEQHCTCYVSVDSETQGVGHEAGESQVVSCVVLTPINKPGETMPFYHPTVAHIAFRYISGDTSNSDASNQARLRIEVTPLPSTPSTPPPTDPISRLYRTCLALLETVHRYGYGALTNYRKRVHHDCVVPREEYQDLYLVMRERHKHLVNEWKETTDPAKHVFEDIGIATFLMLLWKQNIFAAAPDPSATTPNDTGSKGASTNAFDVSERMPWHDWPRPPGGFLDLGCGNGLLTHILTSEGYHGTGIDLRARTSWSHYSPSTRARLQVYALDPLALYSESQRTAADEGIKVEDEQMLTSLPSFLAPGTFIIANHADELTPWTPLLAAIANASGYLSIPCCAWSFDSRFERGGVMSNGPVPSIIQSGGGGANGDSDALDLGGGAGGSTSSYALYRVWLANLSMHCGWENEYETLRIPSTRNWSIVGRRRRKITIGDSGSDSGRDAALGNVREILRWVRERGIFKTRRPEGKAGDH